MEAFVVTTPWNFPGAALAHLENSGVDPINERTDHRGYINCAFFGH